MKLWHILSTERLGQKLRHARANRNQLLFSKPIAEKDISNGELGEYLYCVPTLVGGASFSDDSKLSAIQIELKPIAKIVQFQGNPDDLNFKELQKHADGIDMRIEKSENWPIRFRQVLLWNPDVILNWSSDLSIVGSHFLSELDALRNSAFPNVDFFMTDFSSSEQLAQAMVLGRQLGISNEWELDYDSALAIVKQAQQRLSCP